MTELCWCLTLCELLCKTRRRIFLLCYRWNWVILSTGLFFILGKHGLPFQEWTFPPDYCSPKLTLHILWQFSHVIVLVINRSTEMTFNVYYTYADFLVFQWCCSWQRDCLWPWNFVAGAVVKLCKINPCLQITDAKQGVHSVLLCARPSSTAQWGWIVQAAVWFCVNGYSSVSNKGVRIPIDKTQEALAQLVIIISNCSSKCCAHSWIAPFPPLFTFPFTSLSLAHSVVSPYDITPNHMFSCLVLIKNDLFDLFSRR